MGYVRQIKDGLERVKHEAGKKRAEEGVRQAAGNDSAYFRDMA